MEKTSEILVQMLRENTGRALCDSGDFYGRNWERNRAVDFSAVSPSTISFSSYNGKPDIDITHNIYHWLLERVRYEDGLTKLYDKFCRIHDPNNNSYHLALINEFIDKLDSSYKYGPVSGFYGEGEPVCVNTYNEECFLSQTIQFTYFNSSMGELIALQIHGGCDVRGGYTAPKFFSVGHLSELDIFDYGRASIYCTGKNHLPKALVIKEIQEKQLVIDGTNPNIIDFDEYRDHYWSSDTVCNFMYQGGSYGKNLEDFDVIDLDEEENENIEWESGLLFIKDKNGYCPHCGAMLKSSFY